MRFKLSALLIAAGLVTAQSALAADLPARPVYKAPVSVVAQTWTGLYVGINGGWASSRNCWVFDPGITGEAEGCHRANGAVAGGQIGYNWQFGSTVVGLEAAGDWADLKGTNASQAFPGFFNQTRTDAIGMFTGRLGWAPTGSTLLYVKGGAAITHNKHLSFTLAPATSATASDTRWGWVAGAGVEYAFVSNWSAKLEYLYVDLGKVTCSAACSGAAPIDVTFTSNIIRAGVNYKF